MLVIAFSIYEFTKHGVVSPACRPAGGCTTSSRRWRRSARTSRANPRPTCDPAHPNPLALNYAGRTPLVLAFFATGSGPCKRQVDTLQAVSRQFSPDADRSSPRSRSMPAKQQAAKLVRSQHWTIPVAFDSQGRSGRSTALRSVRSSSSRGRGGVVAQRLIGEHWIALSAGARRAAFVRCCGGWPTSLTLAAPPTGSSSDEVRAEFPGLRLDWVSVVARRRASPRERQASSERPVEPLPRSERRRDADAADPARLPGVLPPDRARSRRRPDPERGGGRRAPAPRRVSLRGPDRRRAADRPDRDRRAGVGARRRRASRPAGSGSARASPATGSADRARRIRSPPGRLVVADAARVHALLFGDIAPGHEVGLAHGRGSCCSRSASPASRRSTSRRRCGCASRRCARG